MNRYIKPKLLKKKERHHIPPFDKSKTITSKSKQSKNRNVVTNSDYKAVTYRRKPSHPFDVEKHDLKLENLLFK